ncbi:Cro/CI family transcriptional regulator [Pseudomonas tremae]|uniref:Cro/CI family transcriptional regulator n=1 Tax=Pseudomonas tremae TaxID=200454 RepID=UPI0004644472|nr:Cro/CI family transcriptional regulator [Pseudomonas tremae]
MTPIKLHAFVKKVGQEEAAKALGASQAAISKALKSGRVILVSEGLPGFFCGLELKGFPSGGEREKSRLDLEEIVIQMPELSQCGIDAVIPSSIDFAQ